MKLKHDAIFYSGDQGFVDLIGPFMAEGISAGQPVLAMVGPQKIDLLRAVLGPLAGRAHFIDMTDVGRNPARIIPAWRAFMSGTDGRPSRGIGEPIWPGRAPQELIEAQRHEELINLALQDAPCWLVCPYDRASLDGQTLDHAIRSHPTLFDGARRSDSGDYVGFDEITHPIVRPLPEPALPVLALEFHHGPLSGVRDFVKKGASALGLDDDKTENLLISAGEVAANSLRHGGGSGFVRMWRDNGNVVCEIRDKGTINDPLAGRQRPSATDEGGYGLWLANQLCDLVQIRSGRSGTTVRMHMESTRRGEVQQSVRNHVPR